VFIGQAAVAPRWVGAVAAPGSRQVRVTLDLFLAAFLD